MKAVTRSLGLMALVAAAFLIPAAQTQAAAGTGQISAEQIEGRWVGFAATPYRNDDSLVKITLAFDAAAGAPSADRQGGGRSTPRVQRAAQTRLNQLLRNQFSQSQPGYDLDGDEALIGFFQDVTVSMSLSPLEYIYPGYEKTDLGQQFEQEIRNKAQRMKGTATVPAVLNTQSGQLIFGSTFSWDRKPSTDLIRPNGLRLVFDPHAKVLLGLLHNPNMSRLKQTPSTALQPTALPVMLWREGAEPVAVMERLGEALNMSVPIPRYARLTANQKAALDIPDLYSQPSPSPAPDRRAVRRDRGTSTAASPEVDRYRDAVSAAQAEENALGDALKAAEAKRSEVRAERREAEGAARVALDAQYSDIQAEVNRLKRAKNEAAKVTKEARKAMNAARGEYVQRAREERGRERDLINQRKRELNQRPAPDINTTASRVVAWVNSLGEAEPRLQEGDHVTLPNHWPNVAQNLFSDAATLQAFGQALPDWSIGDRWMIVDAFKRTQQLNPRDDGILTLPDSFSQTFIRYLEPELEGNFARTLARYTLHKQLRTYAKGLEGAISQQSADQLTFLRLASWQDITDTHIAQLWPAEKRSVDRLIDRTRQRQADEVLVARVDAAIRTSPRREYPASYLSSWWFDQEDFQRYASRGGVVSAEKKLNAAIDTALSRQLRSLVDQIDGLGTGLEAVLAGAQLYRRAGAVIGLASGRPAAKAFTGKLLARRSADFTAAQGEIEQRLAGIGDHGQIDRFVQQVLALPQDRASDAGRSLRALAKSRKSEIDLARFLAGFSGREQSLMTKPGLLQVPANYTAPTAEEIRFAYYRDAGAQNPEDPNSVLMSNPLGEMMNLYVEFEISDLEVLATLETDNGYWVIYDYKQRLTPKGWAYEELNKSPYNFLGALYDLAEYAFVHTIDKFELTSSGWRSSTVRQQYTYGLTATSLRKNRQFLRDLDQTFENLQGVDLQELRTFLREYRFYLRS